MNNESKYTVKSSTSFKKQIKKLYRQGKNIDKIKTVVKMLATGEKLETKYKDHKLIENKNHIGCRECHIEPDWLLIYKVENDDLILVLVETGSHSEILK